VNEMLEKEFKSLVFKKAHLNPGECTQTVEWNMEDNAAYLYSVTVTIKRYWKRTKWKL
jgi:hypothetical protein